MANATRVAKPKKKKKTVGAWLQEAKAPIAAASTWLRGRVMPPSSDIPGQMDYPAISKARETAARRRKLLEEMGR